MRRNVAAGGLALAAGTLAACSALGSSHAPPTSGSGQLPTYHLAQGAAVPGGIVNGRLADAAACVVLEQSDNTRLMIVWPSGYRRDGPTIYMGERTVANVGSNVALTGGSFTESNYQDLETLLDADLPSTCRTGTYWLAVDVRQ